MCELYHCELWLGIQGCILRGEVFVRDGNLGNLLARAFGSEFSCMRQAAVLRHVFVASESTKWVTFGVISA